MKKMRWVITLDRSQMLKTKVLQVVIILIEIIHSKWAKEILSWKMKIITSTATEEVYFRCLKVQDPHQLEYHSIKNLKIYSNILQLQLEIQICLMELNPWLSDLIIYHQKLRRKKNFIRNLLKIIVKNILKR